MRTVYYERDDLVKGRPPLSLASSGACLDRLHIGVRKAEMMADLVNQDVRDDRPQRLFALAPEIQQRPAVEPDHVGKSARFVERRPLRQAPAAKQPEQIEFAGRVHLLERFVIGKIDDLNDEPLAELAEWGRQIRVNGPCELVDVGGGGRAGIPEVDRPRGLRHFSRIRNRAPWKAAPLDKPEAPAMSNRPRRAATSLARPRTGSPCPGAE